MSYICLENATKNLQHERTIYMKIYKYNHLYKNILSWTRISPEL